jgi:hypothetical protein
LNAIWPFLAGLLAGWIFGVWMSFRKIRQSRLAFQASLAPLVESLADAEEVIIKITDEQRGNLDKLTPEQITALFADKTKH